MIVAHLITRVRAAFLSLTRTRRMRRARSLAAARRDLRMTPRDVWCETVPGVFIQANGYWRVET